MVIWLLCDSVSPISKIQNVHCKSQFVNNSLLGTWKCSQTLFLCLDLLVMFHTVHSPLPRIYYLTVSKLPHPSRSSLQRNSVVFQPQSKICCVGVISDETVQMFPSWCLKSLKRWIHINFAIVRAIYFYSALCEGKPEKPKEIFLTVSPCYVVGAMNFKSVFYIAIKRCTYYTMWGAKKDKKKSHIFHLFSIFL